MAQATDQINNIKAKVSAAIEKYGNTVTIRSQGTKARDAWGNASFSGTADVVTLGVTDNYVIARMSLTSAGLLKAGESVVLLKGSETIDETYTIILNSVEHNIMSLEPLKAADIVVAYQLVVETK